MVAVYRIGTRQTARSHLDHTHTRVTGRKHTTDMGEGGKHNKRETDSLPTHWNND